MSKQQNNAGNVVNSFFSGGQLVTGSASGIQLPFTALGLYVGQVGNLTIKTVDNSTFTMVSASGFIPGLVSEISSSTTAGSIIAFK
jgi:hypothetical protein